MVNSNSTLTVPTWLAANAPVFSLVMHPGQSIELQSPVALAVYALGMSASNVNVKLAVLPMHSGSMALNVASSTGRMSTRHIAVCHTRRWPHRTQWAGVQ